MAVTDTLLKSYIYSLDISEALRSELEFSNPNKIRMYSDNERLGIRLRPSEYNKSAEKPEFPNSSLKLESAAVGGSVPSPRYYTAIAYDSNRDVHVMYGGFDGVGVLFDETWEYDGSNWTQITPANDPGYRVGHVMVFDSNRNVIVLYGGFNTETWEYDGVNWTQVVTTNNPNGFLDCLAYYDHDRQRTVLFGGNNGLFAYNDVYEYYSGDWNLVTTVTTPSVRLFGGFSYDKARKVGVLFGGSDNSIASYPAFRDTWEFDGTDWNQIITNSAPTARIFNGQYYDEILKIVVVYAGYKAEASNSDIFGTDWDFKNYYKDAWGYDGSDWFRIETVDFRSDFVINDTSYDTKRCKAFLWFGSDRSPSPGTNIYAETYWLEFDNTDLTCRLPVWQPQAVKGWGGFEQVTRQKPGLIVHWRVSDGTNDYWHNGTNWVVPTKVDEWNTEAEVSANIQSFQHIQKKIQMICRLISASRWETPVMLGTRLLITASFDWFEDLILRSLVPRIEEDFSYLMDWSGVLELASDRFNIKTDYPFTPEEDLNVIGMEAVYNDDTDPNYETDLLQSFNANTGEAILTGSLPAGTRLFYRLNVSPEVVVNFANTDYDELGKTPTVIIDRIDFEARQVKAVSDIALKHIGEGRKLDQPLWVERMRCQCALITGKIVSALRLMTTAYAFVVKGAKQQLDHKIGPIIKTKALDLEHTLKIVPVSRYNPKPNFSDLKEVNFEIIICDFYAWLRDMETKPLVTRFSPTIRDMKEAGTGNPTNKTQPLPAGAIPSLYETPEVEEV